MTVENPRLRLVLGTQWKLLLVVLGVVAVAAFGSAAAAYGDQPTVTDTVDVDRQTVVTNTTERATVVRRDGLWPRGTVLEDKPVYILNATPELETTARTRVTGADAARIRHVWQLRISVTAGEETFYSETRTIRNASHRGTTASTTATIDVRDVVARVANVTDKASGAGTVSVDLVLRVAYRTDPGSDDGYSGRETYSAPLSVGGETYAVAGDVGGSTSHSTTRERVVAQPRDWGTIGSTAFVGLLALVLAGGVVAVDPRDIDVEEARVDLHRTRYEEWISPGIIPMGISQQFVELETIEDVVDVAIDTNERVVYDRRRDLYAVISENVVYYFSTSGSWMESAFRPMQEGSDGAGPGGEFAQGGGDGPGPFGGPGPDAPPEPGAGDGDFGFPDDGESPFSDGGPTDEPVGDSPFGSMGSEPDDSPFGPDGGDDDGDDAVDGGGADGGAGGEG